MMTTYLPMLQERIALMERTHQSDGCGGLKEQWKIVRYVWASIRVAVARTFGQSQSMGQRLGSHEPKDILYDVVMRKEIELKASMRIHWQDITLVVVSDPLRHVNKRFQMVYAAQLKASEGGMRA
jgi:head-tail adaptor